MSLLILDEIQDYTTHLESLVQEWTLSRPLWNQNMRIIGIYTDWSMNGCINSISKIQRMQKVCFGSWIHLLFTPIHTLSMIPMSVYEYEMKFYEPHELDQYGIPFDFSYEFEEMISTLLQLFPDVNHVELLSRNDGILYKIKRLSLELGLWFGKRFWNQFLHENGWNSDLDLEKDLVLPCFHSFLHVLQTQMNLENVENVENLEEDKKDKILIILDDKTWIPLIQDYLKTFIYPKCRINSFKTDLDLQNVDILLMSTKQVELNSL